MPVLILLLLFLSSCGSLQSDSADPSPIQARVISETGGEPTPTATPNPTSTPTPPPATPTPTPSPPPAACGQESEVTVTDAAGLQNALDVAQPCTVILLQPGNYGDFNMTNRSFTNFVTVRSVDLNRPAVFGMLNIRTSSFIRLDGLLFSHPKRLNEPEWTRIVDVYLSNHVEVWRSEFVGSDDGDFTNDIYGFFSSSSHDIVFENNSVHDLTRGSVMGGDRLTVRGNTYYKLRSDGADFGGGDTIVVENNTFSNFHPCCEDHPDHIQFFNNGNTTALRNVIIRGNTSLRGAGDWTQSILVQGNVPGLPNQNFLIEYNVIYNDHLHGISVSDTNGVVIQHNTVLADRGDGLTPAINVYATSANALVRDNVATGFFGATPGTNNNVLVQNSNPTLANHYDRVFFDGNAGPFASRSSFMPKPGGLLIRAGEDVGALEYTASPLALTARILSDVTSNPSPLAVHFDGTTSFTPSGTIATWHWDFGNGDTAQGSTVDYVFQAPGVYAVTMVVTNSLGLTDQTQKVITVLPFALIDFVLNLNFDGNIQDISGHGQSVVCAVQGCPSFVSGVSGQALSFNGTASGGSVVVNHRWDLDGMEQMSLAFWMKKNSGIGGQAILKHVTYSVIVNDTSITGYLINAAGGQGTFNIPVAALGTTWHHIALTYDGALIRIYLDGVLQSSQPFTGVIAANPDREIDIGKDPWGPAFNGALDEIRLYRRTLAPVEITTLVQRL